MSGPPPISHHRAMNPDAFATKIKVDGRTVCVVPRAASQSMKKALWSAGGKAVSEPVGRTIMWIREPFDRLATAAVMFAGGHRSYEDFAQRILSGDWNVHWVPQTELHPEATVFYPFDLLAQTWAEEFPDIELPWQNRTEGKPGRVRVPWDVIEGTLKPETVARLREYYAKDIQAYESCTTC